MSHFEDISSLSHDESPDLQEAKAHKLKRPFQETYVKYIGLFCICMASFGLFYCYGNPQSFQANFYSLMGISSLQFNLLYSAYAFPNFVLPLLGGYISDRIGLKITFYASSAFVTLGQFLFWLGCSSLNYYLALLGRLLFGVGGGTLNLIRYPMLVKWFKDKELGLAYGLSLTTVRIASVANSLISPALAQSLDSMGIPSFLGLLICLLSFVCGAIWVKLDDISDKRIKLLDIRESLNKKESEENNKPEFKAILKFKKITWLFAFVSMFALSSFLGFTNIANDFFQIQYGLSQSEGGDMLSIFYLTTGLFTALFGYIADKFGKKLYLLLGSFALSILSYIGFLIVSPCSYCYNGIWPLILLAIFVALFSGSYWPNVIHLEDKKYIGLLNGFIAVSYNIGEGIFPIIIGVIQDQTADHWSGYYWVLIFLILIGVIGLYLAFLLLRWNDKYKKNLNE